ncbi:MAG: putative endonuclease [Motiliproteus sp.]
MTVADTSADTSRTAPLESAPACWYLYLIETVRGKLYTGITTDIERRFQQHKSGRGGAKFFRTDPPLRLRLSQEHSDRSSASKEEYRIKQLTHQQKLALINTK